MSEPAICLCQGCKREVEVTNGPIDGTLQASCECYRSTTYFPGDWIRLPDGTFYQVS